MHEKTTVLVTAYAVNPYKGSEDGMGWNMILEIARYHRVIAITRENNQAAIDRYLADFPIEYANNIQFKYFDTPYYTRFWKKGGRGALLYFYMWQFVVASWIKKQDWSYDLVHNLNFHNDWTPSFLWRTGKPLVWGPIGHHPFIPTAFLKPYGRKTWLRERIRWTAKKLFWNLDFNLRKTADSANHVFAMNSEVQKVLSIKESKVSILPSVATEEVDVVPDKPKDRFSILSIGRFVALKGFDVTIRSFSKFYKTLPEESRDQVSLTLVGKGPAEPLMKAIIQKNNLEKVIRIIPWIERDQLTFVYQGADLFFFPSHEGAGMVVAEAMSRGLPVLCFDNCGPGEFINANCGVAVPYDDYDKVIDRFADALGELYKNKNRLSQLSRGALRQYRQRFTWASKGEMFRTVYASIIAEQSQKEMTHVEADHLHSSL
jgi:glycosyltransferase involved in cell wall biosynthesis